MRRAPANARNWWGPLPADEDTGHARLEIWQGDEKDGSRARVKNKTKRPKAKSKAAGRNARATQDTPHKQKRPEISGPLDN